MKRLNTIMPPQHITKQEITIRLGNIQQTKAYEHSKTAHEHSNKGYDESQKP